MRTFANPTDVYNITRKSGYLVATAMGRPLAREPDLVVIFDTETSTPINAERLYYGQRVAVLAIGGPGSYQTPEALATSRPRCFGIDMDYQSLATLLS